MRGGQWDEFIAGSAWTASFARAPIRGRGMVTGSRTAHQQGKSLGYEIVEVAKCSALQMLKVRDGADDGASRRNGPRTYVAAISRSSAISETLKNFFSAVS
jgi:hypothetical protein